ncbi:MAG: carboxypeptidase regulatory-like domain-containing protein [Rhodoplanes sp.]|uniref:carboxypeptidase-like regulatory domain-containing protein n=1 Tax=Rhodoplanes sp. TaxID=1968906 RepID=UPI0017BDE742|nr:carboxypeptidase-like regulatory domain-containing protein [Rhodoplanes sp.]NVO14879.1 carboxypeptidase regulatory-like domain-containing protein [Rhodoplanes sp.]
MTDWHSGVAALALATALTVSAPALAQQAGDAAAAPSFGDSDLAGVVTGPNGPEAGVWVIAETTDLPTKYAKLVVTDERGRYVIPELPKASYDVWVRGYGLVDSQKQKATPGRRLDLGAVPAQNEAAAARYYPGVYWYSMIRIPPASEFPGTGAGPGGNGIPEVMKAQYYWVDSLKNSCQSCHALGSEGVRNIPTFFKTQATTTGSKTQTTSADAWALRTQAGQAQANMALTLGRLGPDKAYAVLADWTDRIAGGELPFAKPERPQGLERNMVVTMWDWSSNKHYMHDAVSSDKRNPTVNAGGKIYGSPEESTDNVPVLDPKTHTASVIVHPYRDKDTPSSLDLSRGTSAHWGDEAIWDGHTSIHNPMMDEKGRVWFTARIRPAANPDFCKQGGDHPSAKVAPLAESARQLSVYDPGTQKWSLIDTCFTTHHLYFGKDAKNTLWTSAGGPQSGVVGWLDTRTFDETGDAKRAQGWTPLIIDTNGNGKRDAFVGPNDPVDPTKDKRVMAAFYGVQPSPIDDSIWGQSMDVGFSRVDQPGYIIRLVPGENPAETALAEVYLPPDGAFGSRGLDVDLDGVVWTTLASGHMASFDRSKCKGPLNGPAAATGKHCPEGWTLYRFPGPQFEGLPESGAADHAYYIWVDRDDTLGLGKNVPIASTNGGEALLALVDGKFVRLRVPYPLGFFTKNVDGRVDDPAAGWKGRGIWTTSGTRTVFHNEGGTENRPKVYKVQMRPDPLAR